MVDANTVGAVRSALSASRHEIVIAPAVLYEAAHSTDQSLRKALLSAMVSRSWRRLMPEAYSEAEEVKREVQRLRPEWLRQPPDTVLFKRLRHDWIRARGGQWDRIFSDAEMLQRRDELWMKLAREEVVQARKDAMEWPSSWRETPLTSIEAQLVKDVAEPIAGTVEPWRISAMKALEVAARTDGHATVDWLSGEVDLGLMHFHYPSLKRFWMQEVELLRMPRHWLRWAFEFLQRQYKVTPGTPGDAQLGTYLVDVDLLLSADRGLIRIAQKCRSDAPFRMAEARLVPGGPAAADAVIEVLRVPKLGSLPAGFGVA